VVEVGVGGRLRQPLVRSIGARVVGVIGVLRKVVPLALVLEGDTAGRALHSFPTRRSSDLSDSLETINARQLQALVRPLPRLGALDRKSTRLNSSHVATSYAVFCLKKKKVSGSWPNTPIRAIGRSPRVLPACNTGAAKRMQW